MKIKAVYIFLLALVGVIIFQFLFYKCESSRLNKVIEQKDLAIAACVNAPVKIDTIVRTDTLREVIKLPYTYRVVDTVKVDSLVNYELEHREYTGTYVHPQFEVHWKADVMGELGSLTIEPPSLIKSLVITKEKTVDLTQYITEKPKEKSHLYTTFGGTVLTDKFWGADVGLMYIRKEGWGISAGISTDFENLMYRGGLVVKLK